MRTSYLTLLMLTLAIFSALAQDPGMQVAQQAMQNAQQQSMQTQPQCYPCGAATPKFSVKSGKYSSVVTLKIKDSTRGAVFYYTMDGWTPTAASTRYTGPITIDSTTTLQTIAISPYGGRSRVATAVYTLNGVPPTAPLVQTVVAAPNPVVAFSAPAKLLLARGTVVPFVFASDVSSKTADGPQGRGRGCGQ
jgi:Chitobiase/beta-hexosaminidase C-terminal domain